MRGKTGAARLALATGAPVIPVAMWGPQRVFDPRTRRLVLKPRDPGQRDRRSAGGPEPMARRRPRPATVLDEMTDAILLDIRDLLVGLRGGAPPPELFDPPYRRSSIDPQEPTAETEKR